METRVGSYRGRSLDSRYDGNGQGCEHGSARWNLDELLPGAAESPAAGEPRSRCERFEPITVGAAARVVELERAGIVTPGEARFYLHELLAMDRHAGLQAYPTLRQLAEWQAGTRPGTRWISGGQAHLEPLAERSVYATAEPCLVA